MQEVRNAQIERWLARIVGIFVLVFTLYFIIAEWRGLVRLFEWLGNGLGATHEAIENITVYYQALPLEQLTPSIAIGAFTGALMSIFIALRGANVLRIPAPSNLSLLSGFMLFFVGGWLALDIFVILLLAIVGIFVVAYITQPEMRLLFAVDTLKSLPNAVGLQAIGRGLAVGGVIGGIGSQLLILPMQHCTYAPDLQDAVQYQLGILATMFSSVVVLLPFWSIMLRRGRKREEGTSGYFKSRWLPYALLSPMLINLLIFLYYPSLQTVTLSLNLRPFPLPQERFVCLANYVQLAGDKIYQNSFVTTFVMTFFIVILALAISLGIALLASQKIKYASVYRTLLIWPFALSPVVTGVIFLAMFREGQTGLINALLVWLGLDPVNWLRTASGAQATIIIASVWNILGFNILFYVAGLQNVPKDLLEAAMIDGANRVQRFVWITFPLLSPFTFFLLVTNVTYSFYGIYGAVDTLTQGGPPLGPAGIDGGGTDVLIYKLYQDAFSPGSPAGLAAAQAVVLFVLVAAITILQFRALESRITYGD